MFAIDSEPDSPRTKLERAKLAMYREKIATGGTIVVLERLCMDNAAIAVVSSALEQKVNPYLISLDVRHNQISALGCRQLAASLQFARSLRELQLTQNQVGDDGAVALAEVLARKGACVLQTLSLANNGVTDVGAAALAAALVKEPRGPLTSLDLGGNTVSNSGAIAFAGMLQHNARVTELFLWHNNIRFSNCSCISVEDASRMCIHFVQHCSLCLFVRGQCCLVLVPFCSDDGAAILAGAMAASSTLVVLDLEYNPISPDGLASLRHMSIERPQPASTLPRHMRSFSMGSVARQVQSENSVEQRNAGSAAERKRQLLLQGSQWRQGDPSQAAASSTSGTGGGPMSFSSRSPDP
jgi:hypothetical protein